jgi:hypothetical protein
MTPAPKCRRYAVPMPRRFGRFGIVLWLAFLCSAIIDYPGLDNLAVGFPVFAVEGLPGLEGLISTPANFAAAAVAEGLFVFIAFSFLGVAIVAIKKRARPSQS